MKPSASKVETEIKLRLPDAASGRRKLRQAGFRVTRRRVKETNIVFDTAGGRLRTSGTLVRLRRSGSQFLLTFKGPPANFARHKVREEVETVVSNGAALEKILLAAGLQPSFFYEKYRTEFRRTGEHGCAMLDETPAGVFFELEGSASWIDRTAKRLGFSPADYITVSYATLWKGGSGGEGGMRF